MIGDAEWKLPEICRVLASWKLSGEPRDALFAALDRQDGVYVPSLFSLRQDGKTGRPRLEPLTGRTEPVSKIVVTDLDAAPYPDRPVVPFSRIVHDRVSVEAARGCPHGCRFCQASVLYRPYRERSPDRVRELALTALRNSGYGDMSLLGLSIGDHSGLAPLASSLMQTLAPCRIGLSLPSIRVGSLAPSVIDSVLKVRKTGFTLAPEAATERLRQTINKDIREDELFETASLLARLGWRALKLYFMIGSPRRTNTTWKALPGWPGNCERPARPRGPARSRSR